MLVWRTCAMQACCLSQGGLVGVDACLLWILVVARFFMVSLAKVLENLKIVHKL
jgi:hypothetical protein